MTNPTSLPTAFVALLRRDIKIAYRRRGEVLHPLMFFIITSALFTFATTPDPQFLTKIASAVIWVVALLATTLALDNVFRNDFEDGTLEQLLLSPHPTTLLILAKTLAHWLVACLPLIIIAPILARMLNLPQHALPELLLSLTLGTPTMCLIGAVGAALTLATRNRTLLALLILPLYIPVLIFGSNAIRAATLGIDPSAQFLLLGAMLLFALALAPITIVAALRIGLN